ncbi:YfhO family protein [Enterococcus quebecensis]|uniref:YfhO family protein n=1 Tax=Enterococcus quebecensis TaxID=903983 RepID=A0A1E5H2X5_9ENTE|nr:YfhO family protein [Enterococcus quebecensis]OEG19232.1 hypothetical protein BCR23_00645 [Enterococcus quebecensis]
MNKNLIIKSRTTSFTILFLIVCIVGFMPLMINNYTLIWNIDGVGQYYPAFMYTGRYLQNFVSGLLSGQWVLPSFDLSIGMGEDIIGSLNYYGFGDPLNLLSIFVTKNNSAFLFSAMIILRMWLSGLSILYYFNYLKFSKFSSILSALCYTFSGFALYGGLCYIEWFSVLIYTPLILMGIEKILNGEKFTLFVLAVCYAGLCGFYFLFMSSLILAIYLPVRLLFRGFKIRSFIKTILKTFYAYILGIFLSSPFLFPAIQAYFNSERQTLDPFQIIFNKQNYIPKLDFDFFTYLTHPFYNNSPYLSGVVILQLVSILFLIFLPNNKQKYQCIVFLSIGLFASTLPITGYLFNGFGQTNQRWYYILHILFGGIFVYTLDNFMYMVSKHSLNIGSNRKKIHLIYALIMVSVIANVSVNLLSAFSESASISRSGGNAAKNWRSEFIPFKNAKVYTDSPYNQFSNHDNDADPFFRVSNDSLTGINWRPENVAMLNNYYGLTYWFSIINKNTQTLVDKYKGAQAFWRSYGFQTNVSLNSLYAVKYYMTPKTLDNSDDYSLKDTTTFNDKKWNLYENKNFLGFSYLVDTKTFNEATTNKQTFINDMDKLYSSAKKDSVVSKYDIDKITLTTNVEKNETLILPISYNKNWKASVDGQKIELDNIEPIFMSVKLTKGTHKVQFVYNNIMIKLGLICSFCSIFLLFLLNQKKLQK